MKKKPIFRAALGLNNAVAPNRLRNKDGVTELAAVVNVDIGDDGELRLRKGTTKQRSEAGHSGFCDGGDAFYVSGGDLYRLNPDFSRTLVRASVGDQRMGYVQIGHQTYYGNGFVKGIIADGIDGPWQMGAKPDTERDITGPPDGVPAGYVAGRLVMMAGNVLWLSEPYGPNWFDLASGAIPLPSALVAVAIVDGGLYASDERSVYYINLTDPRAKKVHGKPMLPNTGKTALNVPLGDDQADGAVMLCSDGVCFGTDDGQFFNLTKKRLVLPDADSGCATLTDTHYIFAMGG